MVEKVLLRLGKKSRSSSAEKPQAMDGTSAGRLGGGMAVSMSG